MINNPFSNRIAKVQKKKHTVKTFIDIIGKPLIIILSFLAIPMSGRTQVRLTPDTLECYIVGFSAGMMMPGSGSNSLGLQGGNMRDLYDGSNLNFAIEGSYKTQGGWLSCLDADLWFGLNSDNLSQRDARYSNIFLPGNFTLSWGGYDGRVTAYNRGLAVRPGVGKIINILPKNPNSGILLKVGAGWMMQKTVFNQDFDQAPVPQLNGDYAKLYDHLRNGVILTESIGLIYMSNYLTYINLKVSFDISQCWSWSSRSYQIDELMGLNGKDQSRYFDLMYGFKLTWMFPFTGKPTYDYYYY